LILLLRIKGNKEYEEEASMEWSTLEGTVGKTLCSIHWSWGCPRYSS